MSVNQDPVRRLKGHERRALILEAARTLFSANGYDAISMRDIAVSAGVTRPVLYDHFASKKALVLDLLTAETEALIARITVAVRTDAAPPDRMSAALRAYFEFMIDRPLTSRLILTPATDPDVAEVSAHLRELAEHGVRTLLALEPAPPSAPGSPVASAPEPTAANTLQRAQASTSRPIAARTPQLTAASEPRSSPAGKPETAAASPPPTRKDDSHKLEIASTILVSSVVAVANWWLTHPEVPLDTLVDTTLTLITPGLTTLTEPPR
ncbi:TetR/AcrR family transcriptional regulator [Nocardia sp. NBC_01327]|uniref:TetR/AcrR family transcriptional regulator n=1 Tax=Nocardia sp. NBC_01327 TaxID=2903593 RepID=UPI002E0EE63E|nr:TetR/AcrR family transcriptional regulator [Nocardia sp. NBC_01327]